MRRYRFNNTIEWIRQVEKNVPMDMTRFCERGLKKRMTKVSSENGKRNLKKIHEDRKRIEK